MVHGKFSKQILMVFCEFVQDSIDSPKAHKCARIEVPGYFDKREDLDLQVQEQVAKESIDREQIGEWMGKGTQSFFAKQLGPIWGWPS